MVHREVAGGEEHEAHLLETMAAGAQELGHGAERDAGASRRLLRYAAASRSSSPRWPPDQIGPTVWITKRAGSRPAPVMTASPVGQPPWRETICRHSSRIVGPPRRWIAPSTPPPPSSVVLAAFTIASTRCSVMSPDSRVMRDAPICSFIGPVV